MRTRKCSFIFYCANVSNVVVKLETVEALLKAIVMGK